MSLEDGLERLNNKIDEEGVIKMMFIGYVVFIIALLDTIATIHLFAKNHDVAAEVVKNDLSWLVKQKSFKRLCWNLVANLLIMIYFLSEIKGG